PPGQGRGGCPPSPPGHHVQLRADGRVRRDAREARAARHRLTGNRGSLRRVRFGQEENPPWPIRSVAGKCSSMAPFTTVGGVLTPGISLAQAITTESRGLTARDIQLQSGGTAIPAYDARPE